MHRILFSGALRMSNVENKDDALMYSVLSNSADNPQFVTADRYYMNAQMDTLLLDTLLFWWRP